MFSVVRWLLLAAEGGVQRALRSSAGQRAAQRGTHTLCFCFLESAPSVRFQVLALEPDPVGSSCTASSCLVKYFAMVACAAESAPGSSSAAADASAPPPPPPPPPLPLSPSSSPSPCAFLEEEESAADDAGAAAAAREEEEAAAAEALRRGGEVVEGGLTAFT